MKAGDKVVCINDNNLYHIPVRSICKGIIYTLTEVFTCRPIKINSQWHYFIVLLLFKLFSGHTYTKNIKPKVQAGFKSRQGFASPALNSSHS